MIAALLLLACGGTDDGVPTAEVTSAPFEVVLTIPGELKAVRSVTLSTPDLRGGQAKVEWVIEEGSRVKEGDELVRFDQTELVKKLETAKNDLKVAELHRELRFLLLDLRLGDLANEVTNSELSLQRAEMKVTESETVPRVERESAKIDVKGATIALGRTKSSLESARLEGKAELELLRLDAERAARELRSAEDALKLATLTAPAPGIVILPPVWKGGNEGPIAAGDTVWRGSSIVALPDLADMRVEAWVHEVDAAKIAAGQVVSVVIDAHPEPPHAGKVAKVADLAVRRDPSKAVKHLQVSVSIDQTTELMKPGMTVRAEVKVGHLDEALSIPQEAVFYRDDHVPTVFVRGFGGFSPRTVKLGITNDTHVVVTDGLAAGDVVALVDPEAGDTPSRPGVPGPSIGGSTSANAATP
jgi:multidrug efflux pump subunit AcrA (membrane-fusion protein)